MEQRIRSDQNPQLEVELGLFYPCADNSTSRLLKNRQLRLGFSVRQSDFVDMWILGAGISIWSNDLYMRH
jgi:hypothetical protein